MNVSNTAVRILLVDDHTLFRESLRRVLEADPRFRVVAEASTFEEAIAFCEGGQAFDIALVDYQLSASNSAKNGLAVLRFIRGAYPKVAAILLTAGTGRAELREAVQTFSAGVFLKSEPVSDLFFAIDRTLDGETWVSSGTSQMLLEEIELPEKADSLATVFTPRELMVLRWITEGLSNKEIADHLSISESSVKALLQKLFEKTSVRTRSQLVRYVFETGLAIP